MTKEQKIEEMLIAVQQNNLVFEQDKESEYDFTILDERNYIPFDCKVIDNDYWLYSLDGSVIAIESDPQKIINCIKQILNS